MLVLSRFEGESIVIGDDIEIRLLRVRPRAKVRMGIVAPPHVKILRFELAQADARKRELATPQGQKGHCHSCGSRNPEPTGSDVSGVVDSRLRGNDKASSRTTPAASGTRFASSLSNSKARASSKANAKIPEISPNSNSKRVGSTVRSQEGAGT